MHARDAEIIDLARELLGARAGFDAAVGVLERVVTRVIPGGRVYVIGATSDGPVVGSKVSGIGIAASPAGVLVVRVREGGRVQRLGTLNRPEQPRVVR